jgi:hypothetical protein
MGGGGTYCAGHAGMVLAPRIRMHAVVGIFETIQDARRGGREVFRVAPRAHVRLVSPTATGAEIDTLPTDDAEQPGMGAAVGGVIGGAAGAALATLLVPPVGAAALAGIAGGALLGAGSGAMAGDVVEEKLSFGVPHDELLVYEEAVRRGRALVVAATASSEEADAARDALKTAGAQSVDAAREDWAVGLHDADGE